MGMLGRLGRRSANDRSHGIGPVLTRVMRSWGAELYRRQLFLGPTLSRENIVYNYIKRFPLKI